MCANLGRYESSTYYARGNLTRTCIYLIIKDLLWRRGWDSDCVHLLKTKNLAEFDFLQIR